MTATQDHSAIREQAVALRLAGKSLREIKEIVGPIGNSTLNEMLCGIAPPEWTLRPKAKDEVRAKARELREQGLDYNTIAAQLGVSKSSVSLWVRDLPRPVGLSPEERAQRSSEGQRRLRERALAQRDEFRAAATGEIGQLTDREILLAGAVAYWCEGSKSKPWRSDERVIFTNSDLRLVRMFLRFLDVAGAQRTDLTFRISIHESADADGAQRFWQEGTGVSARQFHPPTLKRHNPKTVRKNTQEDYHGCLRIEVRRSRELYRRIKGWVTAITAAPSA